MGQTKYTDKQKLAICADFALLGDLGAVSEKHGIARNTLRKWSCQAWFKDLQSQIQATHSQRLIAKSHRALDRALDELHDRVELGDLKTVLKGEQVVSYREPVSARTLATVVNVLAARSEKAAELTQKKADSYQLADLRESFRQFATSYRAKQIKDDGAITIESALTQDALPSRSNGTSSADDDIPQ